MGLAKRKSEIYAVGKNGKVKSMRLGYLPPAPPPRGLPRGSKPPKPGHPSPSRPAALRPQDRSRPLGPSTLKGRPSPRPGIPRPGTPRAVHPRGSPQAPPPTPKGRKLRRLRGLTPSRPPPTIGVGGVLSARGGKR